MRRRRRSESPSNDQCHVAGASSEMVGPVGLESMVKAPSWCCLAVLEPALFFVLVVKAFD